MMKTDFPITELQVVALKSNLNLRVKTEPVTCNGIQYVWFLSHINLYICAKKPDIYRCIRSSRDRLGFYAEIKIIFGTADMQNDMDRSKTFTCCSGVGLVLVLGPSEC